MSPQDPEVSPNPNKPIAYDEYGRPLYAAPQVSQAAASSTVSSDQNPQVVYITRAIDPHKQDISPEVKEKHDISLRQYPELNLSEGEFVISAVKRHPIGLLSIWGVAVFALAVVFAFPLFLFGPGSVFRVNLSPDSLLSGFIVLVMIAVLVVLGAVIATTIYEANRFYLTNESVMQHIQTSLFAKKSQTISLGNIEDASYRQRGILQTIFNYGALRLSTEGDETTYRFNFVANPQEQLRLLNNAVEAFKNYRPIDTDET